LSSLSDSAWPHLKYLQNWSSDKAYFSNRVAADTSRTLEIQDQN
jgi:hypothetical protein